MFDGCVSCSASVSSSTCLEFGATVFELSRHAKEYVGLAAASRLPPVCLATRANQGPFVMVLSVFLFDQFQPASRLSDDSPFTHDFAYCRIALNVNRHRSMVMSVVE